METRVDELDNSMTLPKDTAIIREVKFFIDPAPVTWTEHENLAVEVI